MMSTEIPSYNGIPEGNKERKSSSHCSFIHFFLKLLIVDINKLQIRNIWV